MLKIRKEQMEVFNKAEEERFIQRMMTHVHECFSEESSELKNNELRKKVQYQITKAKSYGITAKNDICDFISICFVLGDDFDTDPDLESINAVLKDPGLESGPAKMMHLEKAVTQFFEQTENDQ